MSKNEAGKVYRPNGVSGGGQIATSLEWFITAFILALFFRGFVLEPYRIPTASMADTLMGTHFRLRCEKCGIRYDYGFDFERYNLESGLDGEGEIKRFRSRCPSCGHIMSTGEDVKAVSGDRILVLRCLYNMVEPKRWEVVVFKNPLNPSESYIKRLAGLPGEKLEIIDGDVYINGFIARKPAKLQEHLWMLIYDNDYEPSDAGGCTGSGDKGFQPFKNFGSSNWRRSSENPTVFQLETKTDEISTLKYDTEMGNGFRASCAYNDPENHSQRPYCSDLMFRCFIRFHGPDGVFGAALSKYGTMYKASVSAAGKMVLSKNAGDGESKLVEKELSSLPAGVIFFKFANVDHKLALWFGEEHLSWDAGPSRDSMGPVRSNIEPELEVLGSGRLLISHLAVYRDIHYMSARFNSENVKARAIDEPFRLGSDEYFVLGDNSPVSEDSRWWREKGMGNNGVLFRAGVVPRDYLVGKAICVYWPSCFRPFGNGSFVFVPNAGRMRLIY